MVRDNGGEQSHVPDEGAHSLVWLRQVVTESDAVNARCKVARDNASLHNIYYKTSI